MIPLTLMLRKQEMGYQFGEAKQKINHLLFMDDLKLFADSDSNLNKLLNIVHKFSNDIGMDFGLDKCAKCTLKKGKNSNRS